MSEPFEHAPPPVAVDGLTAVPVDIALVDASTVFDLPAATASVDVTMHFTLGPDSGHAVFDLRQEVDAAWLDGTPISVAQLAHHDLGGGSGAQMRVLGAQLAAGSSHTLRLQYDLATPDAAGAVPIGFDGTRLSFDFWFSDLAPGRYLEMWLPANLVWDQFELRLDVSVTGTARQHVAISNGTVATLGANHWRIEHPGWWNSSCPMLVIEADDRVSLRTGTVNLPGVGPVTLEIWRQDTVGTSLTSIETALAGFLTDFSNDIGPYLHGNRFVAYIWDNPSRAMEYAGGTTTSIGALGHEAFHSWFARGVLPAGGDDGWFDEAITTWMTGGTPSNPLGLGLPPSVLCARHPYARMTPSLSYSRGRDVFGGLAADIGVANLKSAVAAIYARHAGGQLSTEQVEPELVVETGRTRVVDWFQRYVYGLTDEPAGHDLWLRDAPGDPGHDAFTGSRFWDSPDIWVRNDDDGGTSHDPPEFGQDNWFQARVRNRGSSTARHFLVTFRPTVFAGSQFVYPADWLPPAAAVVGFDLPPGTSTVVKARWPKAMIPPPGSHVCLLASVSTTVDPPISGRRVWEHNNLAQKNLTVVDLVPNDSYLLTFQIGNRHIVTAENWQLELRRPLRFPKAVAEIETFDPRLLERLRAVPQPRPSVFERDPGVIVRLESAARVEVSGVRLALPASSRFRLGSDLDAPPELAAPTMRAVAGSTAQRVGFGSGSAARLPLALRARETARVGLRIEVPPDARPGEVLHYDVLQRSDDGTIVGGVALEVRVVSRLRRG